MKQTEIEWTDLVWNPIRGCSPVSAGCTNCYAMAVAHRFSRPEQPYAGLTERRAHRTQWTGQIQLVDEALDQPLHRRHARRIFVNSMSDLFHEQVPFEFVHRIFETIRRTPHHTYQILTKRPARMRAFITDYLRPRETLGWANGFYSHVWFGVSVEDQQTANERIPLLLSTPAAVRWVSAEPLLGPVDLRQWQYSYGCPCGWGGDCPDASCAECGWRGDSASSGDPCPDCNARLKDSSACPKCNATTRDGSDFGPNHLPPLNWVVVGGESGPRARPCHVGHLRHIVRQCHAAQVPVFVKQLGARPYLDEGSLEAKEWGAFDPDVARMDDTGQIHPTDRQGRAMREWPEDLRVRAFPSSQTSRTLSPRSTKGPHETAAHQ